MSKPVIHRLAIPTAIAAAVFAVAGCSGGNPNNPAESTSTAPLPGAAAPVTSAGSPLYNPATGTTAAMANGATSMAPATASPMANANMGNFADKAEQGGMFEIKMAELALQKSNNEDVKSFAQRMKKDHTAANNKLEGIVGSSGQLPTNLDPDQQQKVDSLQSKSGTDFDKAYADVAVENHQKTISLFENASNSASSQELRDFASQTLPTLEEHLQLAQQLQSKLGGG